MRRLARWTLNTLTVLSLLLCVATCVLWVRSYRKPRTAANRDSFDLTHSEPLRWLIADRGRLTLCRQAGSDWRSPKAKFNVLGLEYASSRVGGSSLSNLLVPFWMLATALSVAPAWRAAAWALGRRCGTPPGRCAACSYDLTGNVSGVCPECGAAVVKADA